MGIAIVLLVVDAVLRFRISAPGDAGLNHQHSSRWALGTSYCRPVADIRPPTLTPSSESRQEHQPPHIAAGPWEQPLSCSSPTPACDSSLLPTPSPIPISRHRFESPTAHRQGLASLSSQSQHPIDQQRTPNSPTHLCRSLCSQLASSPHDHHRCRPCSQLARDRTTAHPAPTHRKPLLPTRQLTAHKLFQHPR